HIHHVGVAGLAFDSKPHPDAFLRHDAVCRARARHHCGGNYARFWLVVAHSRRGWGATSISAVAGVWSVVVALAAAIVSVIFFNRRRLPALRQSVDAGANASVLPALSVASLVGFGAVIAALPAFAIVRDWVLGIEGGPLV